jgi:glycosyltransferase involved in cell wall biosynthesis
VAGDNPGYRAVLKEHGKLSLVNPKYVSELVRRLAIMLEDRPLQDMWRAWAQDYVKQFSYERVVDQYEQIYRRALSEKRT